MLWLIQHFFSMLIRAYELWGERGSNQICNAVELLCQLGQIIPLIDTMIGWVHMTVLVCLSLILFCNFFLLYFFCIRPVQ